MDQKLKSAALISEITSPKIKGNEIEFTESIHEAKHNSTFSYFVSKFGDPQGVKEVLFNEFDRKN